MRILVVDDDGLAATMTAAVVEAAGHEALLAENAVEALEKLSENADVSLVVSDMNMPLVNGIELFRTLREQGIAVPFLLLTGDDPAAILAREPALDGVLRKDEDIETTLIEAIGGIRAAK